MSKLREDYQFVYDTLSLRASMLIATNSMTGDRGQSNIHIYTGIVGSSSSSGKDGLILNNNNRQTGEADSNITAIPISISNSVPLADSDANRVSMHDIDCNTAVVGRNNDTANVGMIDNRSESPSLSIRTGTAISAVTIACVNTADEEGEVMALLRSLESRRKIQVSSKIRMLENLQENPAGRLKIHCRLLLLFIECLRYSYCS